MFLGVQSCRNLKHSSTRVCDTGADCICLQTSSRHTLSAIVLQPSPSQTIRHAVMWHRRSCFPGRPSRYLRKACPRHPRGPGSADKLLRRALDVINRAWPIGVMRELRAGPVFSYSNDCHYSDHKRNGYLMSRVARDVDAPQRFRCCMPR